jgi:hypothetical protein
MPEQPATVDKTPREQQVREAAVRGLESRDPESFRKAWKPAEALPMPKSPPGIRYRYIRKSIAGQPDVNNYGRAMREGWVPVPLKDHPELSTSVDPTSVASGNIEIGALILCKISQETIDQRTAYFNTMTARQMEAVDNNLMRENDPRMPLFSDRESKVSFGKGT